MMEKLSYYNHYIPIDKEKVLLYNSFRGSYSIISDRIYTELVKSNKDISQFEKIYNNCYAKLKNVGAIVDEDVDEINIIKLIRLKRRFSLHRYDLTINTTMNCNLRCWYCYENHVQESKMTIHTSDLIFEHIVQHYNATGYKVLSLSFFGGEPLLNPKICTSLLSRCKQFCDLNNIQLLVIFTTNGTLITEKLLNFLNDYSVHFQITFDGSRSRHDKIRFSKQNHKGSYDKILLNLQMISQILQNYSLRVRINIENDTLESLKELLDDINFIDRTKSSIGIHKIWQVDDTTIDYSNLYDFVEEANQRKHVVDYNSLKSVMTHVCYADNYNQVVINYDGSVFKCTARDFTDANKEGNLLPSGTINWNVEKILYRMSSNIPIMCEKCKLLPACPGICSQKIMDGKETRCSISELEDINDIILINFNQYLLQEELKQI